MNSASLCSLVDRYNNPIPSRFLALVDSFKITRSPYFKTCMVPRNWFQGINSASLCSLAGRYENPIHPQVPSPHKLSNNSSSVKVQKWGRQLYGCIVQLYRQSRHCIASVCRCSILFDRLTIEYWYWIRFPMQPGLFFFCFVGRGGRGSQVTQEMGPLPDIDNRYFSIIKNFWNAHHHLRTKRIIDRQRYRYFRFSSIVCIVIYILTQHLHEFRRLYWYRGVTVLLLGWVIWK